jgi:HTH-type transcriptional regulator/antitoxin HigA
MAHLGALEVAWTTLNVFLPLHPIRDDKGYDRMRDTANELSDKIGDDEQHPLFSLFELVLVLIEQWEDRHVSVPDAAPEEVLRFLLKDHKLRQKDLADIASPTLISDILAGRRAISKKVAIKLAKRFNVGVSAFI